MFGGGFIVVGVLLALASSAVATMGWLALLYVLLWLLLLATVAVLAMLQRPWLALLFRPQADVRIGKKRSCTGTPERSAEWIFANTTNPRLYPTSTHKDMLETFLRLCEGLSSGAFVGHDGLASRLVVGSEGIGKTVTAKSFLDLGATLFDDVLVVYVNCAGVAEPQHPLRIGSLAACIMCSLGLSSILDIWRCDGSAEELIALLRRRNKRMLIIVDELDELYRLPGGTEVQETLGNLQVLGNSRKGVVATVICGSSATLPLLISQYVSPDIRKEFPTVYGAPNLNETRFRKQRIILPTPTDLSILKIICPGVEEPRLRLCLFLAGSNVREVHRYLNGCDIASIIDSYYTTMLPANARRRSFLFAILDKLYDRNKAFLAEVYRVLHQGDVFLRIVQETKWEATFKSLRVTEVQDLWEKLQDQGEAEQNSRDFLGDLLHLSDEQLLVVTLEGEVFPWCVSLLMVWKDLKEGTLHYLQCIRVMGGAIKAILPDMSTTL